MRKNKKLPNRLVQTRAAVWQQIKAISFQDYNLGGEKCLEKSGGKHEKDRGILILAVIVLINQVKPDKKYLAKIDIVTYKDETTEYDVMEIISKVKEK